MPSILRPIRDCRHIAFVVLLPLLLLAAPNGRLDLRGYLAMDAAETRQSMPASTSILFADAEGSARLLLAAAQSPRPVLDDAWTEKEEWERCRRYSQRNKLEYRGRRRRRRIFWGSLVADDSWHTLAGVALEAYGIFRT